MKHCKQCYKNFKIDKLEKVFCSIICRDMYMNRQKNYNLKHKKEITEYLKIWRKQYYIDNKEKERLYAIQYYKLHKKEISIYANQYAMEKRKIDINFRILCNARIRIWKALKGINKSKHTIELLGCSIEFLKEYIENKFTKGMTWNNYGLWHIDHIVPCYDFDLRKKSQQLKCFNYTNLQPLWAKDNRKKGYTITSPTTKSNSVKDKTLRFYLLTN